MLISKIRQNPIIYSICFVLLVIIIHQIPLYRIFENLGLQSIIANLLDKILLNLVVIIIALKEIKKKKLFEFSGLSLKKIKNRYLYLILVFYLFIFTGGFSTIRLLTQDDLLTFVVLTFLIKSISVGFLEEIVFRSLIQGSFMNKKKYGVYMSVFISALIFAFAHIINIQYDYISISSVASQIFAAFCLGSLFGAILIRTKNIYPIILIHSAISFFSLLGTLFPEYFPDEVKLDKSTPEIIASIIFSIVLFGSAFLIAYFILKNPNKNDKTTAINL